jgi:hypothetical protein
MGDALANALVFVTVLRNPAVTIGFAGVVGAVVIGGFVATAGSEGDCAQK